MSAIISQRGPRAGLQLARNLVARSCSWAGLPSNEHSNGQPTGQPARTWNPCHTGGASSCGSEAAMASRRGSRRAGEPCGVAPALPPALPPMGMGMAMCLLYTRVPPAAAAAPSDEPPAAALLACLALIASILQAGRKEGHTHTTMKQSMQQFLLNINTKRRPHK